jgi:hypothetical protein
MLDAGATEVPRAGWTINAPVRSLRNRRLRQRNATWA